MKFADPQTIICPSCEGESVYSVAALLAFEARCSTCGQTFAKIGEGMHRGINDWTRFLIAMHLSFAIEHMSSEITIPEQCLQTISCLDDLVSVAAPLMNDLLPEARGNSARDLVCRAVRVVFPFLEVPSGDVPLVDAFREHMEAMYGWFGRSA